MSNVTQAPPVRYMNAAEAALLRWHPRMSLRMAAWIRQRRPGFPLIAGGQPQTGRALA